MKKFCITFLMSGIIILSAIGFGTGIFDSASAAADTEYLRIHIRANSNSGEDQAVKYMVRDEVVKVSHPRRRRSGNAGSGHPADERKSVGDRKVRGRRFEGSRLYLRRESTGAGGGVPHPRLWGIYAGSGRLSGSDPGIGYGRGGPIGGASSIRRFALRASRAKTSSIKARSKRLSTSGKRIVETLPLTLHKQEESS